MVVFCAYAHNRPSSVPAFSFQLQHRGHFMHQDTKSLNVPSISSAQNELKDPARLEDAAQSSPSDTLPCLEMSRKEHPCVFVQQPLLSFSRQGHAGCQVQVSAPG